MLIWSAGGAPPAARGNATSVSAAIRFQLMTSFAAPGAARAGGAADTAGATSAANTANAATPANRPTLMIASLSLLTSPSGAVLEHRNPPHNVLLSRRGCRKAVAIGWRAQQLLVRPRRGPKCPRPTGSHPVIAPNACGECPDPRRVPPAGKEATRAQKAGRRGSTGADVGDSAGGEDSFECFERGREGVRW